MLSLTLLAALLVPTAPAAPLQHQGPHLPSQFEVVEVPGDHDSMVLEPNVRVLAARVRSVIEAAEHGQPEVLPFPIQAAE